MNNRTERRATYLKDYPAVEAALRMAEKNRDAHAELLGFLGICDDLTGEQLKQLLEIADKIAKRVLPPEAYP